MLLYYSARALTRIGTVSADAALARHIEEIVGVELMHQWATAASVKLENGRRNTAPGHVRRAEEIIEAEASDAPTIEEGAHRVVSLQALSLRFPEIPQHPFTCFFSA